MAKWSEVEAHPLYQGLSAADKSEIKGDWLKDVVSHPLYGEMPVADQQEVFMDATKMLWPKDFPTNVGRFSTAGFFANIGEAYKRGDQGVDIDLYAHEASKAGGSKDAKLLQDMRRRDTYESNHPLHSDNWLTGVVQDVAGMLPGMLRGISTGQTWGLAAAGGAAVGGAAGPQIALPEEMITVPAAYAFGTALGSLEFWRKQGTGFTYAEAVKAGVDPKIASWTATAIGPVYAAIEMVQVGKLLPKPLKASIARIAQKSFIHAASVVMGKFGVRTVKEALEEGGQEVATIMGVEGGKAIDNLLNESGIEQTSARENVQRVWRTFTQSLAPMALLGSGRVALELADAKSASRKDVAEALGVPQSKLPPEYNTQPRREKAIAEAKKEVRRSAAVVEAEPMGGSPRRALDNMTQYQEAREALGAEQAAQRREDFQRQREAPPAEASVEQAPPEVAPIEPPVEQAPVEAPQPEDAEMEPPLDDVAIDEGPVAYPEEGRPGVVEEEAKEAEKAAEADVMREEAQAEQAPAEAPPMEAVAPQDDRPKQSPARTDVVTQADWLRHASLEAKLFKDKALTPDQQAEYEALNEKIGRHYAGPDRFSRETQDVPAEAPVDTEVEGEAAIADAIENPEDASFLSRQADAARARAAKRGPPGARLNVGIPVDQIADMAIIGMDNFAKGARTFTQWSRTMIAELGDGVKGNLKWLWDHLADERKALTQQAYRIGGRVRAGVKAGKDKPLSWTPEKLFNYAMHHEARGSRAGYRAGQLDQKATVQELLEYANAMLPASEAKIVAKAVKRISKARTPGEIKKVVDAINRMAGNYEKASAKKEFRQTLKRVKKADLRDEFRKKVDTILDGIAITQPRDATLDRFEQLLKAADLDDIGEIPQALIDKAQTALGKVGLPALSDMEAADIRDVSRAIEAIINLSGRKNLLLYGKQQREEKKAHAAVNDEIVERLGSKYALVPGKRDSYSRRSPVRKTAGASQQNHQVRTFRLFGRNPIGEAPVSVGRTILYDNLQDADRGHKSKMQETEDAVNTLLDEAGVDRAKLPSMSEAVSGRRLWGTRHAQALARGKSLVEATTKADTLSVDLPTATTETGARVRKLEMTAAERMHLLLHFLDSDTRAQVLSNQASGIVFDRRPGMKPVGLKVGDVRAIIDSASDQERQIVLGVHALINGPMRNAVNAYWLKKYGYNLSERSDYTPRRRDASGKDEDIDANQAAFIRNLRETLEDQPIVQDRTGSKLPIVVGDIFGELFAHANQVYALSEKADAIEDARRLLGNAKFKETVKEALRFGTDELAYMKLVLDEFEGLRKPDRGDFDQVVKAVMKGARRGLLGLKPNIVLYQPASYALASSVIPESVLYRPDVLNPMGHAEVIAEMRAEAPEMRARIDGSGSQIITPLVEGSSVGDFYHVPGPKMDKVALGPIHAADTVVMVQLWRASKIMGEKAGRNPGPELKEYTRDMMREVVARSQPSWDEMHSSMLAIQARSKALMAPLVVFSSQINKLGNIITENVYDIEHVVRKHTIEGQKRGLKGTKLAEYVTKKAATPTAKAVKNLGMATVVNAAMIVAIRALYFGGISLVAGAIMGGGDDREKGKEFWTKSILAVVDQMLGLWMVYGDAISTANRALRKGMEYKSSLFVRPRQTIPYAAAEAAIKAVGETSNALSRAQDGKKNKMQLYRAMNHYVDLLSFGGVPLQGPWAIVRPFAKPRKATPKPKRRKH